MPERDRPIVYVHALAPPHEGGTTVILQRLLSSLFPPTVITVTDLWLRPRLGPDGHRIPGPYRWFLRLPPWGGRWRLGRLVGTSANVLLAWFAGAYAACVAVRRRGGVILSVADNGFSVIAGDVAARLSGRPHVVWVFDLWEENAYTDVERWWAHRLEPGIWRRTATIVCHAEELAQFYERKHGVRCTVLPTPIVVDPASSGPPPDPRPSTRGGPREVIYAGAVYWAQEDALRRLARACARLDDVRLTIVGDEQRLRAAGIAADRFEAPLGAAAFRDRIARADVVVLGLSFDSAHPEVIATATPARLPEYMVSGAPLLVHAPAGSHVAEYARREDFAEVVDTPDDAALAAGLRRVVDDQPLSSMRARRARALAFERHDIARVRQRLLDALAGLRQ